MRAADEIRGLRAKFGSLSNIAREIEPSADGHCWPVYHAAVASGLAGDIGASRRLFERVLGESVEYEWQRELQAKCLEMVGKLNDREKFREGVVATVQESRLLHRLRADLACLDGVTVTGPPQLR
jgi:hypothetical protein